MAARTISDDEYDALSDDFGDIDFDNVPALSAPPVLQISYSVRNSPAPEEQLRDDGSDEYGFDDDLDTNTLDALDALEQSLAGPSSSQAVGVQGHLPVICVSNNVAVPQRALRII